MLKVGQNPSVVSTPEGGRVNINPTSAYKRCSNVKTVLSDVFNILITFQSNINVILNNFASWVSFGVGGSDGSPQSSSSAI